MARTWATGGGPRIRWDRPHPQDKSGHGARCTATGRHDRQLPAPVETAYRAVPGTTFDKCPDTIPSSGPDVTVMKDFFAGMDWLLSVGPGLILGVCSFCVEHK